MPMRFVAPLGRHRPLTLANPNHLPNFGKYLTELLFNLSFVRYAVDITLPACLSSSRNYPHSHEHQILDGHLLRRAGC